MQFKRIIPCLDVRDGRVVKGVNFVDIIDVKDPVESAKAYSASGADELVFLDINASTEGRGTMLNVVRRTAQNASIPFIVGGGIRSIAEMEDTLAAGADKVSINSPAVKNPGLIEEASAHFGSRRIIVAIDAKRIEGGWEVYINGGQTATGLDVVEWAVQAESLGAGEILLTSMDADGTKKGFDVALTHAVSSRVNIPVIASGGAGSMEDFYEVLTKGGADAALAASLFHFGILKIEDLKKYLSAKGVLVKL